MLFYVKTTTFSGISVPPDSLTITPVRRQPGHHQVGRQGLGHEQQPGAAVAARPQRLPPGARQAVLRPYAAD